MFICQWIFIPAGFGYFVFMKYSGNFWKLTGSFVTLSLAQHSWEQDSASYSSWHALSPSSESWLPSGHGASRSDSRGSEDYCWCYPKPSHQLRWSVLPCSAALMTQVTELWWSKQADLLIFQFNSVGPVMLLWKLCVCNFFLLF